MLDMKVRVVGGDEAIKALRIMEPATAREVAKEVSKVGKMLVAAMNATTPSNSPSSHWAATSGSRGARGGAGWPAWSPLSYRSRRSGMTVYVNGTAANSAIPAMFETLGRRTSVKTKAGEQFIKNMDAAAGPVVQSGKKKGRARRVAGENYAAAFKAVKDATDRAVDEVNRRMP